MAYGMGITRRDLMRGGVVAAGAAALGTAARPSTARAASAQSDDWYAGFRAAEYEDAITETIEADICIVGAGMSGLCAALEAAQQGKSVALLESQDAAGGSANYSDGMFSFGSPECLAGCEAEGVTVTAADIIRSEIELYDYTVNSLLWVDLLEHSADNTKWLQDAGVRMQDKTIYYPNKKTNHTPTTLPWYGGQGTGATYAIDPLLKTLAELGVEPRVRTRGRAIKMNDDGSVAGVYAETEDGVLEVLSKVVIIAGGGWCANVELTGELGGFDMSKVGTFCAPGSQGDGLKMAGAVGARQDANTRGYNASVSVDGISYTLIPTFYQACWVNENGERFCNEDHSAICNDFTKTVFRSQGDAYVLLSEDMIDMMAAEAEGSQNADGTTVTDLRSQFEEAAASDDVPSVISGTVEELAERLSMDPEVLAATVATYNGYAEQGRDDTFAKDPAYLMSLGDGILYACKLSLLVCVSLGGINTNRNFQVVNTYKQPIPGLYAVGADGNMVYTFMYNLGTSGGFMANNIESGRYAVKHAITAYL